MNIKLIVQFVIGSHHFVLGVVKNHKNVYLMIQYLLELL